MNLNIHMSMIIYIYETLQTYGILNNLVKYSFGI